MNIVVVSSEVAPFSKSGGLADVCGALPAALARRGHRVLTVSPHYATLNLGGREARDCGLEVGVHAAGFRHDLRYRSLSDGIGLTHLFVDHPMYQRGGLYGDEHGAFRDNHIRFAVLCRAALEAARRVPLEDGPLGEDVLFHANDWHSALLPMYLEALYRPLGLFPWAGSVLTIHNIAHQGHQPAEHFNDLELAPRWNSQDGLEWYGDLNLLKGGVLTADAITTVSPNFAREIATPAGGFGLDGVIRRRQDDLVGILNGIDTKEWNPREDPHLDTPFDPEDLTGKAQNKAGLQRELGLPVEPRVPLVGSVGRLDPQKGVELLIESIPWLVQQGAQVVVLGSAAAAHGHYETALRELEARFPERVRAWIGFSERMAHRIEAGSDMFVMPSRFEPSGLNQFYSLRYGSVPIVRSTGGLVDSVEPADLEHQRGTGYRFGEFTGHALRDALYLALEDYRHRPEAFAELARRGMRQDHSWNQRVRRYEAIYRHAFARRGRR